MQVESFDSVPLADAVKAYLYAEYADDPNLQAFIDAANAYALGYLSWFLANPLGVYTNLSGQLLDWVGQGVYGMRRPFLASGTVHAVGAYDTYTYNTDPYDAHHEFAPTTAVAASDDIYKRCLTWNLYRGDGQVFSLQWLKNRVSRFLNGVGGSDVNVLNAPANITVSDGVFTVTAPSSSQYTDLAEAFEAGVLVFPFQYSMVFST